MITFFSDRNISFLFYGSLIIFLITALALLYAGFSLLHSIALFIPGLIVALVYNRTKKENSEYWFYFFLDGLMMFSAVLLYLFSFGYI